MLEAKKPLVRWRNAVAVGVLGGLLVIAPSVSAQPLPGAATKSEPKSPQEIEKNMAEAKSRYKAGLSLYDDGAYDAARVQFERAYELAPSYKILYNIGLVYKQLNEFVGALKTLQKYISEGGAEVPEDRKVEVTKMIETLKPIIGSATVTVNVPGAEIMVDDAVVGKSPMTDPILLNPGRRKVGAKLEGRLPDAKVVTVASGDKVAVDLVLGKQTTIVQKGGDFKPVVAWIVTGALAVGAGITGYLTLSASNDLKTAKGTRQPDPPAPQTLSGDLSADRSKMKTLGLVSDLLSIGTILAAGTAVYFTWFNKDKEPKEKDDVPGKPDGKKATNAWGPITTARFGVGPGSAGVSGTF